MNFTNIFGRLTRGAVAVVAMVCLASCAGNRLDGYFAKNGQVDEREISLTEGVSLATGAEYENFILKGQALTAENGEAALLFHSDGEAGYEITIRNGVQDGSIKTGSLRSVRNLYRSLAEDGEWFDFEVAVRGKNIAVKINGVDVVCYTEPEKPYREAAHAAKLIGKGKVVLKGVKGDVKVRHLAMETLASDARNESELVMPAIDEQTDHIIRFQQKDFPVIDWHVHLKGGLTKEQAHAMSMNYGINYGVAPNAGEGGVGRMLADDAEVRAYYEEVKNHPFLFGVQGEGRKWTQTFSQEALGIFDYLFTDAMTIIDHNKRNARIYRAEEVIRDGVTMDQYMEQIVDQTVKILTNEPADIFANATYIPDDMNPDYAKYWTAERVDRVLDVMEKHNIALEISARYKIPSLEVIKEAKKRGLKFTFGTNNVDADFGRLEYCFEAVEKCGLTVEDMWFPTMSVRRERPVVIYNHFDASGKRVK